MQAVSRFVHAALILTLTFAAPAQSPQRLAFVENAGQWAPGVHYAVHGSGLDAALEPSRVVLRQSGEDGVSQWITLDLGDAVPRAEQALPGRFHYLLGDDPGAWVRDAASFARVVYEEVAPGIDLVLRDGGGVLQYDLRVAAGAALERLRIRVEGVTELRSRADGGLDMVTPLGPVLQGAPLAFQLDAGGDRTELPSRFVVHGDGSYGFAVEGRDPALELVVDPPIGFSRQWATFLGGSQDDQIRDVVVDGNGSPIACGVTDSLDFPALGNAFQASANGGSDVFVARFSPDGTTLLAATFLGGSGSDTGFGIALDPLDNVVVCGITSSPDFPTSAGAFANALNGGSDSFAAVLDAGLTTLLYGTYLGGPQGEAASAVAVDSQGRIALTGNAQEGFPTTTGAFQEHQTGSFLGDVFVALLAPQGQGAADLVYSTLIGGEAQDYGRDIAVGPNDDLYVAGFAGFTTRAATYPTTPDAFLESVKIKGQINNLRSHFMSRVRPAGQGAADLVYSTFLVDKAELEETWSVAVDGQGRVFLTGNTSSDKFPVTANAFQPDYHESGESYLRSDAFLLVLDPSQAGAAGLVYGTYLGGSEQDIGRSIALDSQGNVAIGGHTIEIQQSSGGGGGGGKGNGRGGGGGGGGSFTPVEFPTTEGNTHNGGFDGFVVVFEIDASGNAWSFVHGDYHGGSADEDVWSVAFGPAGNVFAGGSTGSADFPANAFDTTLGGGTDGFLLKLARTQ